MFAAHYGDYHHKHYHNRHRCLPNHYLYVLFCIKFLARKIYVHHSGHSARPLNLKCSYMLLCTFDIKAEITKRSSQKSLTQTIKKLFRFTNKHDVAIVFHWYLSCETLRKQ
ncbi:hypothetical protein GQX74_013827 [Glossina fuscipes]|nr:hypothetical protein GQX74_013827 [Glossina fuscipes]